MSNVSCELHVGDFVGEGAVHELLPRKLANQLQKLVDSCKPLVYLEESLEIDAALFEEGV